MECVRNTRTRVCENMVHSNAMSFGNKASIIFVRPENELHELINHRDKTRCELARIIRASVESNISTRYQL